MRASQAALSSVLAAFFAPGLAQAQYLINELSFGHNGDIAHHGQQSIPHFALQGAPSLPEVLSNRVILTPVAPGNQRGAIWSDRQLTQTAWIADVDFRVNGQERGGGNLNIWLTQGGASDVGTHSAYTVGRFDGLVIVVDSHNGAGMIRGFLNDRTTDYKAQTDIGHLAFGHCSYTYRNLGRPSQLKIRQGHDGWFRVEIDGHLCFESNRIHVPANYQFGITAASAHDPDSFEVFKLVVMSENWHDSSSQQQHHDDHSNHGRSEWDTHGSTNSHHENSDSHQRYDDYTVNDQNNDGYQFKDHYDTDIPDQNPDKITSSQAQFADLHNRIQGLNHHISSLFRYLSKDSQESTHHFQEIVHTVDLMRTDIRNELQALHDLSAKFTNIEHEMQKLRSDVNIAVKNSEAALKGHINVHHDALHRNITSSLPGHGRLIFVIIGTQAIFAVAYVLYKRRRNSMPKKFL